MTRAEIISAIQAKVPSARIQTCLEIAAALGCLPPETEAPLSISWSSSPVNEGFWHVVAGPTRPSTLAPYNGSVLSVVVSTAGKQYLDAAFRAYNNSY